MSGDGSRIGSASCDKTVRVWDGQSGECLLGPLHEHEACARCVPMRMDGSRSVLGSGDETVRVRDLESPLCYFNGSDKVSNMFSRPRGGAVELWFSKMVSRLSRTCPFDENEAHYLASEHRKRHDECVIVWNTILSETMSNWSLLNCDGLERKWKAQIHGGRVLFEKVKSQSFIIFMCDFFMAYDDESNLVLIIVPLSKALIVSPEDFSMNDLLDEVPEEQVHFVARRLLQLTSVSWTYDCLSYLEKSLQGAERLSKISNLFDGQFLDLEPCYLEVLVGCRVGLVDSALPEVPYSHRVGLEISGTVIGLVLTPTGIANPEVLRDAAFTIDNGITNFIDISIGGGDHVDVKRTSKRTRNNAQKVLNLSYVPQNKDFEKSRKTEFNRPEDLEKVFIDLGYGEQLSHVMCRAATTHLSPGTYSLGHVQEFVLRSWRNCSHQNLVPLTFNYSKKCFRRKALIKKETPFLVINNRVVHVAKSRRNIQKNVTLGLNTNFANATVGFASSTRDIIMVRPVSNLLDATEHLHGVPTGFDNCGFDNRGGKGKGNWNWYKVHREGMSNILCALAFISVMLKGKVDPRGEFGGCVPCANPEGQKVVFNIPVPYGLAKRTFAAGYEPNIINAVEESGPIYSLNGRGWNPEENYTTPAVLAASGIREEVKAALLAEAKKRTSNEAPRNLVVEPAVGIIGRGTRQLVETVHRFVRIPRESASE